MVRVETMRREWAEALALGDAVFTKRFGHAVEAGWWGFPEALKGLVDGARADEPDEWGAHLFFDEDGALVGVGGWKGPPVDRAAELGYAVAPARQGRGIATAAVRELVRRAHEASLVMVTAHTLAEESPSTTVLRRCGFVKVAEFVDPDDGPVWRWQLLLEDQ